MAAVIALVSSLLWGAADFGGGLITKRLPALVVVGWSQICALVALGGVLAVTGLRTSPGPWLLWGLAAGAAGASGLTLYYRALATGTMGVVSPIAALGVLVPVLLGLAQGERPGRVQAIGMAVALAGALAASGPELSGDAGARSMALAVGAGVLFGATMSLIARGSATDPLMTAGAMRVASLVVFGGAALLTRSVGGVRPRDLPAMAAVGVCDAGANLLFGLASTMGMISLVAVLGSVYPVVTVLLARVVLAERLQRVQVLGVVLAMVGVAMISAG